MSPPPPPMMIPSLNCLPFNRGRQLTTEHSNDSSSTITLTTAPSKITKCHFTEDSESYMFPKVGSPTPSFEKGKVSPPRLWNWARRWDDNDSVSTLVSGDPQGKESYKFDPPVERVDTGPRLAALRKRMAAEGIDYFIIPSEDGHLSEYTAPSDHRRQWISGFTGSSGTAIVSKASAYLFTDSRYWAQAERELDHNWRLQRSKTTKEWIDWILLSPRGCKIGVDSRMISHEDATRIWKGLYDRGSKFIHPRQNLVDLVWEDRPKRPNDLIYQQPIEFTGKEAREKLHDIRRYIRRESDLLATREGKPVINRSGSSASNTKTLVNGKQGSVGSLAKATSPPLNRSASTPVPASATPSGDRITALFISDLAQVAYVLNLRGSDITYNPVFAAYLIVSREKTVLFVDSQKLTKEIKEYLYETGVSIREYSEVWTYLRAKAWGEGKIILNPSTPYAVSLILGSNRFVIRESFVEEQKAIKNEAEIQGFRNAYLRDGAAVVKWLAWLDHKFRQGYDISEWEAADKLTNIRSGGTFYVGPAYESISASGPNAALPHYTPTRQNAAMIDRATPYLMDSGGQYRDGTCDTTRTMHFGYPTAEQAEAFTRVLQGHIAIDTAIFPEGTTGAQLDVLARKALWRDGLNYGHGTGHGFGSFLNVHEGPHGFSTAVALEPGHVITNEPGFYKEGQFGIRIESALLVRKVDTKHGGQSWLGFERFTQVPIQMKMVRSSLLTKEERQWIKDHNNTVRRALEPFLQDDKRALKWIRRECARGFPNETKGPGGLSIDWD